MEAFSVGKIRHSVISSAVWSEGIDYCSHVSRPVRLGRRPARGLSDQRARFRRRLNTEGMIIEIEVSGAGYWDLMTI